MKVKAIAPLVGRYSSFRDSARETSWNKGVSAGLLAVSGLEQVLFKASFEFGGLTFKIGVHPL